MNNMDHEMREWNDTILIAFVEGKPGLRNIVTDGLT